MKNSFKIIPFMLIGILCVYTGCKKTQTVPATKTTGVTADIGKQIALNLYKSLTGQFGGANVNNDIKTQANVSSGAKTQAVMGLNPVCGDVVENFPDNMVVVGDTTRHSKGHFRFVYMCNGYFDNNYNVDAYTLADSLITTETGTHFYNTNNNIQNYVVKSLDASYQDFSVGGNITSIIHTSVVNGSVTTAYHDLSNQYTLEDIAAAHTATGAQFMLGKADFTTTKADLDPSTGADGTINSYSGYMVFLPNNTLQVNFKLADGSYKGYVVNLLTGTVTDSSTNTP